MDYNLGVMYKIMLSGDRSVFYEPPQTKADLAKAKKKT